MRSVNQIDTFGARFTSFKKGSFEPKLRAVVPILAKAPPLVFGVICDAGESCRSSWVFAVCGGFREKRPCRARESGLPNMSVNVEYRLHEYALNASFGSRCG